jgi:hypothetical protein
MLILYLVAIVLTPLNSFDILLWIGARSISRVQCERCDDGILDTTFQHRIRCSDSLMELVGPEPLRNTLLTP